ncbi:MAG: ABC transporter ATP-binding protein, partial [Deltaproteobacteria bacterium]|nr:ABC transporter ATP-binding protein [Deltaproteobacteria bacterium]
ISFDVPAGGTIALVGESGCGKSVTALSILRLVQSPPGRIESGRILLRGKDLLHLSEREMRKLRGSEISMIFQEPMTSLNPVYTVGAQIVEAIRLHQKVSSSEARKRAIEMLAKVGIPSPQERIDAYPHQLSGGMRQRVMIAMALSCEPKLLIADEPTTALDVTIQAQILDLLAKIRAERGLSVVLITHDLGIVAEFADEVVVMYAGKVAERAKVQDLFAEPLHPYTRGLLRSVPSYGENAQRDRLPTIEGVVPDLRSLPRGCRFQDRCPDVAEVCRQKEPPLVKLTLGRGPRAESSREVACFVSVSAVERASDRGPAEVVS